MGEKVLLDADLARFYGITTGALNRAVKRNPGRFPADFMFELTADEAQILKCQIGISRSKEIRTAATALRLTITAAMTQGSFATLGFETESRWDSTSGASGLRQTGGSMAKVWGANLNRASFSGLIKHQLESYR